MASSYAPSTYIGCKAKRQGSGNGMVLQLLMQLMTINLHTMHPTGLGPGYLQHNFRRTQLPPSAEENTWALRYSILATSSASCWCHLGSRISLAWARRYSRTSGASCWCHLGSRISLAWARRYSITSGARCWRHLGSKISVAWALPYNLTWRLSTYYIGCQEKRQRVQ